MIAPKEKYVVLIYVVEECFNFNIKVNKHDAEQENLCGLRTCNASLKAMFNSKTTF